MLHYKQKSIGIFIEENDTKYNLISSNVRSVMKSTYTYQIFFMELTNKFNLAVAIIGLHRANGTFSYNFDIMLACTDPR